LETAAEAEARVSSLEDVLKAKEMQCDQNEKQLRELHERNQCIEDGWEKDRLDFAQELARTKAAAQQQVQATFTKAQESLTKSRDAVSERQAQLMSEVEQMGTVMESLKQLMSGVGEYAP
jgi:hypothetical protein